MKGGGTQSGILELSKTHVSNDCWGYLEHKTLNMYGSIFQKDPPLANHFYDHFGLYKGVIAVIAVGAL